MFFLNFTILLLIKIGGFKLTDVDIKIENIVASASIGKDIVLTEVSQALEGVNFNREQFPGLVFKLKDPKTAALIFSSGKLVCTGAKSIDDSKLAIKKTVDLMREVDTEIPHEFEIKIQNIVASANLESTLNLEAVALELEDTEYEPEQFPGLVYRLSDPKVVLLLFGSGKVVCTGAKTKRQIPGCNRYSESVDYCAAEIRKSYRNPNGCKFAESGDRG